jgi:hypothetical protein
MPENNGLTKDDLKELKSTEVKLLNDLEKGLNEYMQMKANIQKQIDQKNRVLEQKKVNLNNKLSRALNNSNSKIKLRAASIYDLVNSN